MPSERPPSASTDPDRIGVSFDEEIQQFTDFELWGRSDQVTVRGVSATNFRSFRELELQPGRLTALVGANAAGKSSVIDTFRFISDSLSLSLYTALERRGGLRAVRHTAPGGRPRNVRMSVELDFGDGFGASYGFRINAQAGGSYSVAEEECRTWHHDEQITRLLLKNGRVAQGPRFLPPGNVDETTLALPVLGGLPNLSPVLSALRDLRAYSIVPDQLRELQDPDEGQTLLSDGSNAASVLRHLEPADRTELIEMLSYVVPGVVAVRTVTRGNKLTLQFTQESARGRNNFEALQMSDGTLRLLGLLLALYQREHPRFMAIEEPEATIHVAALQALMEVFRARSPGTQIVLTTHSTEILDSIDIDDLYLVVAEDGYSRVSGVSDESRRAVEEALFSPGELLRSGALTPAA